MPRKEFESFTRLDASDVNTYLMDQSVMTFAGTAARGSAITTPVEGMVTYLQDSNTFQYWDSAEWDTLVPTPGTAVYSFVTTLYYTSSGTFTKGDYPWLKAIRAKVLGGGGGSAGCASTTAGQIAVSGGGGGGGYAEKFITNIASLGTAETITRGAGGAAGAAGAVGSNGGNSSAFSVQGNGGNGGAVGAASDAANYISGAAGGGGTGANADFIAKGEGGREGFATSLSRLFPSVGGGSFLAPQNQRAAVAATSSAGIAATSDSFGCGAIGAVNIPSSSAQAGAAGAPGIVILELYA